MREIALTRGLATTVDDEDFDWLNQHKWWVHRSPQTRENYYAVRQVMVEGRLKNIYMHREILRCVVGQFPDHINGNGLDNRRCNLRVGTRSQNNANRDASSSSGFRGVYLDRHRKAKQPNNPRVWVAMIGYEGVNKTLGRFATAEDAARAYDAKARLLFGEFARLNFAEPAA